MIKQFMQQEAINVDSYIVGPKGLEHEATYSVPRVNTRQYIQLPYINLVLKDYNGPNQSFNASDNESELWREVGKTAINLTSDITGNLVLQDWVHQITCVCSPFDVNAIQQVVNNAVYDLLLQKKVIANN